MALDGSRQRTTSLQCIGSQGCGRKRRADRDSDGLARDAARISRDKYQLDARCEILFHFDSSSLSTKGSHRFIRGQ
jgi:hypothetical protein